MSRQMLLMLCSLALFCLSPIVCPVASAQQAGEILLAEEGKTTYVIVLPIEANAVVRNAAEELKSTLEKITGAEFPIVSENEIPGGAALLCVGDSQTARELFDGVDFDAFRYDEILILSRGKNILLTGHERRGALYAVVSFLEDTLGCRWWTSTESFIPQCPTLSIPAQNLRYAPQLIYRESFYRDAFEEKFAVRSKCNGNMARISPEWGGHHRFVHFVHSFYPLIPPEEYFKEHPEWFSEIDGVRKAGYPDWISPGAAQREFMESIPEEQRCSGGQLCLSNDEMRAEFTKNALERLRANPGANFISISQNDWRNFCTCEKCREVDEKNGSPAGSLIEFVNKVAADIEKEFPEVWVETLAYQYTRKPPTVVKPRHNVVVRLCTIECSFLQPLESGALNASLKSDIEGWSQIAHQLFVWDYITNFSHYLIPHPNMRVLAPNLRFFVKNKTIGLFEQGDSFTTIGDFVAARNWVVSHLLWNPNLDEKALWDEFFHGYYGAAGTILQEYLDVIHDRAESTDFNLRCFLQDTRGWLDPATILQATEIADAAENAVADDPVLLLRVRRALAAFRLNFLLRYYELALYCKINDLPISGPDDPAKAMRELLAFFEEQGTHVHREAYARYSWENFKSDALGRFPAKPATPPDLPMDWENTLWIDFQDAGMNVAGRDKGWGEKVDDPAASDGRAIRMPGWHFEWAAAQSFPAAIGEKIQNWHVYGAVRCDAKTDEGVGMTCGIYDWAAEKSIVHKTLPVSQIKGEKYVLIDFGTVPLSGTMYIWFAPPKRPDEVQNVYVDRFFLIEEESE
ncbi:MAG: DUF4838 domain-containing protein [Planctomycetia bacterium]|nr:DUF4838 domain-containing protein [Planctomycetia bacterium]